MTARLDVAVIGGGLAGATATLALLRRGLRVRLFEQASAFTEVGAGITLSNGALQGYRTLGLREEIVSRASAALDVAFYHYRTGRLLAGTAVGEATSAVTPVLAWHVHRADLHDVIVEAIRRIDPYAIALGKRCIEVERDGKWVHARFADGGCAEASLLIGADGLRSTVRRALFQAEAPVFAQQVAYRCLIPIERARAHLRAGPAAVYIGHGKLLNRYLIRQGTVVNCVAVVVTDRWREEGWNVPATTPEVLEHFADAHADVTGLLAQAPATGLVKWALYERPHLESWHRDNTVLIGDAAHPMLPFLGLGGTLAIEDALVLDRVLSLEGLKKSALVRFEQARGPRAAAISEKSRLQGKRLGKTLQLTRSHSSALMGRQMPCSKDSRRAR